MPTPVAEAAAQAALDEAGVLITGLSKSDRTAVQKIISDATYYGWTPTRTARRIAQVVGLSPRQRAAVTAHRSAMRKAGKSPAQADRAAQRYAARLRKARAKLIAEHEVRTQMAKAQREDWAQQQHDGVIGPRAVRVFKTHKDERTCKVCRPLNGRRQSLRSSANTPPLHPNCRCTEELVDETIVKGQLYDEREVIEKVRRVATPRGVKRYGLPIGAPIVADGNPVQRLLPGISVPEVDRDQLLEQKRIERVKQTVGRRVDDFLKTEAVSWLDGNEAYSEVLEWVDPDNEGEVALAAAHEMAGTQGVQWPYFGGCRAIRKQARRIVERHTPTTDPHLEGPQTDWAWGYGGSDDDIFAETVLMMRGLMEAPRTEKAAWRGATVSGDDWRAIKALRPGEKVDLPLISFAEKRSVVTRFGDNVAFKLEKGARVIRGGMMEGPPRSIEEDSDEWYEWYDEELGAHELATGGTFTVRKVYDEMSGTTVVVLRQDGVFDPRSGEVVKGVRKLRNAWLDKFFDAPLFTKEDPTDRLSKDFIHKNKVRSEAGVRRYKLPIGAHIPGTPWRADEERPGKRPRKARPKPAKAKPKQRKGDTRQFGRLAWIGPGGVEMKSRTEVGDTFEAMFALKVARAPVARRALGNNLKVHVGSAGGNTKRQGMDVSSDRYAFELKTMNARAKRRQVSMKPEEVELKKQQAAEMGLDGGLIAQIVDQETGTVTVWAYLGGFTKTTKTGRESPKHEPESQWGRVMTYTYTEADLKKAHRMAGWDRGDDTVTKADPDDADYDEWGEPIEDGDTVITLVGPPEDTRPVLWVKGQDEPPTKRLGKGFVHKDRVRTDAGVRRYNLPIGTHIPGTEFSLDELREKRGSWGRHQTPAQRRAFSQLRPHTDRRNDRHGIRIRSWNGVEPIQRNGKSRLVVIDSDDPTEPSRATVTMFDKDGDGLASASWDMTGTALASEDIDVTILKEGITTAQANTYAQRTARRYGLTGGRTPRPRKAAARRRPARARAAGADRFGITRTRTQERRLRDATVTHDEDTTLYDIPLLAGNAYGLERVQVEVMAGGQADGGPFIRLYGLNQYGSNVLGAKWRPVKDGNPTFVAQEGDEANAVDLANTIASVYGFRRLAGPVEGPPARTPRPPSLDRDFRLDEERIDASGASVNTYVIPSTRHPFGEADVSLIVLRNRNGTGMMNLTIRDGDEDIDFGDAVVDLSKDGTPVEGSMSVWISRSQGNLGRDEVAQFMDTLAATYGPTLPAPKKKKKGKGKTYRKLGKIEVVEEDEWTRVLTPESVEHLKAVFGFTDPVSGISAVPGNVNWSSFNDSVGIEGSLRDANGKEVGTWTRVLNLEKTEVDHSFFEMESEEQGQGFMQRWFDQLFDGYVEDGFVRVKVHANISVGGYAWARKGFEWKMPPPKVKRVLGALIQEESTPGWLVDQCKDLIARMTRNEKVTASEIADLGLNEWNAGDRWEPPSIEGRYGQVTTLGGTLRVVSRTEDYDYDTWVTGHHIGKAILLGSDWYGHLDLGVSKAKGLSGRALFDAHTRWVEVLEARGGNPNYVQVDEDTSVNDYALHHFDVDANPADEVLLQRIIESQDQTDDDDTGQDGAVTLGDDFRHKGRFGG